MRPSAEEISAELGRILHSGAFQHSGRLSRFLSFVVTRTLDGGREQLKEFTIALAVYDKSPDFDPRLDSIVRVEASRLRSKLREYYETEGREDRVRIELPKGGYAPVFRRDEATVRPRHKQAKTRTVALAVVAVILIALVSWLRPPQDNGLAAAIPRPLTTWPGSEIQPCVSPDGSRVALVWNGPRGDNYDIYVLRIGDDTPARLTSDPAADRSPAWSRDGTRIAFLRDAPGGRQLLVVGASGGPEHRVATLGIPAMAPQLNVPRFVEWSLDGLGLIVSDMDSPESPYALYLISVETGEKRKLTSPPATEVGDRDPALSADGRFLAFTRSPAAVTSDIYMLPLAGGEPTRLTFINQPIRGLAWSQDDRSIVFSCERDATAGSGGLLRVETADSRAGRPVTRVGDTGPRAALPSITRQGDVLVFQDSAVDVDIWRAPTAHPGDPSPLISSTREEVMPDYSPDGRRIAFCSNRSGHWEIWSSESDGSGQRQLTHFAGAAAAAPRWSADGRQIAFVLHTREGASDIYVMTADGGSIRRLTSHPARDERPSWSKTGTMIYFHSNRTGANEVWQVSPGSPGTAARVTYRGGAEPVEDPDGRYLYYRTGGGREIWKRLKRNGSESMVSQIDRACAWTVGRRGVYLTDPHGVVVLLGVDGQQRAPVAHLPSQQSMGLAVSPDDAWLLFQKRERAVSDVMVVSGYR